MATHFDDGYRIIPGGCGPDRASGGRARRRASVSGGMVMRWTTPQHLPCNPARLGLPARVRGRRRAPRPPAMALESHPRLDLPPVSFDGPRGPRRLILCATLPSMDPCFRGSPAGHHHTPAKRRGASPSCPITPSQALKGQNGLGSVNAFLFSLKVQKLTFPQQASCRRDLSKPTTSGPL